MAVPMRLTAFALALVITFGLSFGIGRATGDTDGGAGEVLAGTSEAAPAGGRPDGGGLAPGHRGLDHSEEDGS